MIKDSCVIDDFYTDPDIVRKFALSQKFDVTGNYPGVRTKPFLSTFAKNKLQTALGLTATKWFDDYCGCFQTVSRGEETWIHADKFNDWAAVCYLHPKPEAGTGTSFHSIYGQTRELLGQEPHNPRSPDWVNAGYTENVYNRLILYKGDLFHQAAGYFGSKEQLSSQRLIQVFFFNT